MNEFLIVAGVMAAVVFLWSIQFVWPRPLTVRQHERGLRYRRGRLLGEVGPGRYWLQPRVSDLKILDTRRRQVVVPGQEVLTSDRVPLKISLIAEFAVSDVTKALTVVERFEDALYGRIQLALREAVADRALDEALEERGQLGAAILGAVAPAALEFGVRLDSVQVRDFMMAAGLRGAYADVVQAKQQGLAALERARGESAAVRKLANTASLMERHPGLMQLRLLQAVESGTGNRIVIAMDPTARERIEVEVEADSDD